MAIALDAVASDGGDSWSHTCSGENRILFVFARNSITGVTYAGVAMTKVGEATSDVTVSLWVLVNPALGANNVVLSGPWKAGCSVSYTGAKQSGQPDAFTTKTQTGGTTLTVTLTTVADNCWTVVGARGGGTLSGGTGTTLRSQVGGDNALLDSNGAVTPPGPRSMEVIQTGSDNWAAVMASFAPFVAPTTEGDIQGYFNT